MIGFSSLITFHCGADRSFFTRWFKVSICLLMFSLGSWTGPSQLTIPPVSVLLAGVSPGLNAVAPDRRRTVPGLVVPGVFGSVYSEAPLPSRGVQYWRVTG